MTDTEQIKPALSATEWASWRRGVMNSDLLEFSAEDIGGNEYRRHAVAALALYGQSYGFTQDDVQLLRGIAAGHELIMGRWPRAADLADRIQALLPPEKP